MRSGPLDDVPAGSETDPRSFIEVRLQGERLMQQPVPPFWFKQRQAKCDSVGEESYKLTAPLLPESFIAIRRVEGGWQAVLKPTADGSDTAVSGPYAEPVDAWGAAFELFRAHVIN